MRHVSSRNTRESIIRGKGDPVTMRGFIRVPLETYSRPTSETRAIEYHFEWHLIARESTIFFAKRPLCKNTFLNQECGTVTRSTGVSSGCDDFLKVEMALCVVVWGSGVGVTNPSRTSIGIQITKALATEGGVRRLVTGGGPSLGPSNHARERNDGSHNRSR